MPKTAHDVRTETVQRIIGVEAPDQGNDALIGLTFVHPDDGRTLKVASVVPDGLSAGLVAICEASSGRLAFPLDWLERQVRASSLPE